MNKRLLYFIIGGLVMLLLLGGALFYLSKKQPAPAQSGLGPLKITKVLDERVVSPIPAYSNSSIWYFNSEGRLFKANIDGSNLSEFPLPSMPAGTLSQVLWPQTGTDFIALLKTGGTTAKIYFDSANKVFLNMPANVQWVDWLPDGKRVIYIWQAQDLKSQQLVIANPDGTGYKKIADVFWPDLAVRAGAEGKVALLYRTSISGDTNKIYAVNLSNGQIVTLVDQGKNLAAKWLPSGNGFLYSQASTGSASRIFLYDLASHKSVDLNLTTTLDNVAVDSTSQTIYAAELKPDNSSHTFVKIDLGTGKQTSYFEPGPKVNVSSVMLVGNTVYFVNGVDGKLYTVGN